MELRLLKIATRGSSIIMKTRRFCIMLSILQFPVFPKLRPGPFFLKIIKHILKKCGPAHTKLRLLQNISRGVSILMNIRRFVKCRSCEHFEKNGMDCIKTEATRVVISNRRN